MAEFEFEFDDFDMTGLDGNQGPAKVKGLVDVIFVIDVSGSMGPAIVNLTKNIHSFVDNIDSNLVSDFRIKIVSFSDLTCDTPKLALNLDRAWIDNPRDNKTVYKVQEQLNECIDLVRLGGGCDEPESSLDAVYKSISLFQDNWCKRRRVIVLFSDASAKEITNATINASSREDKLKVLIQTIEEEHIDLFIFAPTADDYIYIARNGSRIEYNAINEDGSAPVTALRNLNFDKVLENLGKTVSQPSDEEC